MTSVGDVVTIEVDFGNHPGAPGRNEETDMGWSTSTALMFWVAFFAVIVCAMKATRYIGEIADRAISWFERRVR